MKNSRIVKVIGIGLLMVLLGISGFGQAHLLTKGVYTSSVSNGVDLFSGQMEQSFPLLNIQGRGETSHTLFLPLRNDNSWQVNLINSSYEPNSNTTFNYYKIEQQTSMLPSFYGNNGTIGAYSNRGGYASSGRIEIATGWSGPFVAESVTFVKFISNSGATIDFRDQATNGQPKNAVQNGCVRPPTAYPPPPVSTCSRGRVFRSTDGSNVLFVSDTDIYDIIDQPINAGYGAPAYVSGTQFVKGTIYFPNGTKVRIGDEFNNVTKITDRNGNTIDFNYGWVPNPDPNYPNGQFYRLLKITDSLKREVSFNYGDATQSTYFDEIIYKGFGGAEKRIKINYKDVSQVLAPGQQLKTIAQMFPGFYSPMCSISGGTQGWCQGNSGYDNSIPQTPKVVSSIVLPNDKQYSFLYNSYFEVSRITSPLGSYLDYQYAGLSGADASGYIAPFSVGGGSIHRRVASVKTYTDSGQLVNETDFSNIPQPVNVVGNNSPAVDNVIVDVKDSNGNIITKTKHYFYENTFYGSRNWLTGKEYKTEVLNPTNQAILRKTETTWQQREPFPWCGNNILNFYSCDNTNIPLSAPPNDPRVTEVKTTLETGQVTKKTFTYDQYNNVTDTYEYDYGNGQAGQFLRRSHTDYVTDTNYTSYTGAYLPSLPSQNWVSSDLVGSNKTAFSQIEYDNYSVNSLLSRSNVSGHDSANYSTTNTKRGNPTKVTSYENAQNQTGAISVQTQFDILGNLIKTIDAKGNASIIDYSDKFGSPDADARSNSLPSQLNGQNTFAFATYSQNQAGYESYSQFDYYSGLAVDVEDINGNVSTVFYNDILDRPTQTISANNRSTFRSQTTTIYDDVNRKVTVTSDLYSFGDNLAKGESFYDSLGRATETRSYETGGYTVTAKPVYDDLGRVIKTTNPYRPYINEQPVWTSITFDELGRVSKIKTPDNVEATTNFSGNVTTAIDQAGKKRRSITNAIGQLTRVDEPNSANDLGDVNNPNQPTYYTYNTNGNLVKVTQGSQNRYFLYDSLGRLIRVRQPEQNTNSALNLTDPVTGNSNWSTGSTYDANGNALTSTDAKGVTITSTYDNLNRPLTLSYSDGTPTVTNTYDNANVQNSRGQLTKISSSISATEYTAFDVVGKVLSHRQITDGQTYNTAYNYTLTGALIEETYPSGRVVKNTLDNDGKLVNVATKAFGQSDFHLSASNFTYLASGAVASMRYGNGRWESAQFNSRLQITQIGLGSSQNAVNLWQNNYQYGEIDTNGNVDTNKNNGSVARQTTNFAGLANPFVQSYKYDSLSRLTEAKEMSGTTQNWIQNFSYDRYGNRTSFNQLLGTQQTNQTPTVDTNNNRFTTGQGYVYDFNGNLITDNQGRQFTFNGDNKQTQVKDVNNNVIGSYSYDGTGARVKKISVSETTIFVYNAGGKLVAEYSTALATNPTVSYLTSDRLGSPRVITDNGGNVSSRRDFMPFGEDLYVGTGRTTGNKYGSTDSIRQKFTGYEKDTETGLDFAEARYYNNQHGRFTAVDPLLASGKSVNPQTFNRYVYVANDPTNATDPSGLNAVYAFSIGLYPNGAGTGDPYSQERFMQFADEEPPSPSHTNAASGPGNTPATDPATELAKQTSPLQAPTQIAQWVVVGGIVDTRQDSIINAEIASINATAKPLANGETPIFTTLKVVVGNTYSIYEGNFIDMFGTKSEKFTGIVSPIAYIPLDQGGNVMDSRGLFVQEVLYPVSGVFPNYDPKSYRIEAKIPYFIDIQSFGSTLGRSEIKQDFYVGQLTKNNLVINFATTGNSIVKNTKTFWYFDIKIGNTVKTIQQPVYQR